MARDRRELEALAESAGQVQAEVGPHKQADFVISLPVPSADALSANLYGHSTWRPLSRAER
jgi:hypothetical protein